ncbi:MAG TPA: hypothetical protein PLY97_10975, partial [Acidocella sp.]|nr:hypothetical protein [Acidocella sp.]
MPIQHEQVVSFGADNKAQPESLLLRRLRRFWVGTRLAYAERGMSGGTRYVLRTVYYKTSVLIKNKVAHRSTAALRKALVAARDKNPESMPHVALLISGGIGDLLVVARFIRDFGAEVGGIHFNVFVARPALANWAFSKVQGFAGAESDSLFFRVMEDYDLAIQAHSLIVTYSERIRWRALRVNPRMLEIVFSMIKSRVWADEFVNPHPYLDNILAQKIVQSGASR